MKDQSKLKINYKVPRTLTNDHYDGPAALEFRCAAAPFSCYVVDAHF
jgi:hypothetical protein